MQFTHEHEELRRTQEARVPLYERTKTFKAYCPSVVPGWLQTPAYATALLSSITAFHGNPDDLEAAVGRRVVGHDQGPPGLARECVAGDGDRHRGEVYGSGHSG